MVPAAPDTERTIPPKPTAEDWQRDPKQAEADTRARHENTGAAELVALGWTERRPNVFGIGPDPDEHADDGDSAA